MQLWCNSLNDFIISRADNNGVSDKKWASRAMSMVEWVEWVEGGGLETRILKNVTEILWGDVKGT